MKSHVRKWDPHSSSPWLTRAEAADYLRCTVRTVDRILVKDQAALVPGKLRFVLQSFGGVNKVRIRKEDAYSIQPLPLGQPVSA